MSLTKTQASCKCGASISTAFTSELADWLGQHQQCLISQPKRYVACPCGTATPREPLTNEQKDSIIKANKMYRDSDEIDVYGVIDDIEKRTRHTSFGL